MRHNKTFLKIFLTACLPAIVLVAVFIHFTSCTKPDTRHCVCTDVWDKTAQYHYPDATTNAACEAKAITIHRNQDVSCIVK